MPRVAQASLDTLRHQVIARPVSSVTASFTCSVSRVMPSTPAYVRTANRKLLKFFGVPSNAVGAVSFTLELAMVPVVAY